MEDSESAKIPCPSFSTPILEAFFTSTVLVALAEIGDKTQLLSFVLAAKLRRPYPSWQVFSPPLFNHALAASVGAWLASLISPQSLNWVVGLSFIGCGLWALKPDALDGNRAFSAPAYLSPR